MRRLWLLFGLVALAGCSESPESKLLGNWQIDPASIKSSHLVPNTETKPEWAAAKEALSSVQLQFSRQPKIVMVSGFGRDSSATWRLLNRRIEVLNDQGLWPVLDFDPKAGKIHAVITKGPDTVEMDFVKR